MANIKLKARLKAYSLAPFYNDWVRDLDSQLDLASGEIIFDTTDSSTAYVRNYSYLYVGVVDGARYKVVNNTFTMNSVEYSIEFYGNVISYVSTESVKYIVEDNKFTIDGTEYTIKCDALLSPVYVITGDYYAIQEHTFEINGETFDIINADGKLYAVDSNHTRYEISNDETFTIDSDIYYLIGIKSPLAQWYPIDISMNNPEVFSKLASMSTLQLTHRDDTSYTYDLTLDVYNYNGEKICTQIVRLDLPTEEDIAEVKRLIVQEEQRATDAELLINNRINDLDLSSVGSDGNYIKTVSQLDGLVSATTQQFDRTLLGATHDNAPTSKAVKDSIDLEHDRALNVELGLNNRLTAVEGKIPSAASSSNKLVDTAQMQSFAMPITTKYGANLIVEFNKYNGLLMVQLKDQDGNNLGQAQTVNIDLQTLEDAINAIQILIPTQASPNNQLADKDYVDYAVSTNTANFIGTFNNIEQLLSIGNLAVGSILLSGSIIRDGSVVNGTMYDHDVTLSSDLTINGVCSLSFGSIINVGSTIEEGSAVNHVWFDTTTTTDEDITIETWTNNDYSNIQNSVVTNNGEDFDTKSELDIYTNANRYLITNYDYAWVVNGNKFDLYRWDQINQVWELRVEHTNKDAVTLNTVYNRYKFNGSTESWEYEFTINNTTFNAAQWAAINSGITDALVNAYSSHIANTNNPHNVTKAQVGLGNVDNVQQYSATNPNFGSSNPEMDGIASAGSATTYSHSDHIHPSDTTKADKVLGAISGDFASLDANGNLTDSGKKSSDFLDSVKTIQVSANQIVSAGSDAYTSAQYIRFAPTTEQAEILANNDYAIIKLDLTALGNSAPAPYVWLRRNTVIVLPNPLDPSSTIFAYQFTCGGEQFWYDNYQTDIAIKNIGNAALVAVPALGVADITLLSISVPDLYNELGKIPDKVDKTQTIAGIDLQDNITKQELITALNNDALSVNDTTDNIQAIITSNDSSVEQGNLSAIISSDGCTIGDLSADKNGRQTIISSKSSTTNGNDTVVIAARESEIISNNNSHSTESAIIGGYGNTIVNTQRAVIAGGNSNRIEALFGSPDALYGFIGGGQNNQVRYRNSATIGGQHLTTNRTEQVLVGRYNDITLADVLFAVGNGTAENSRSNAMTVYNDGMVDIKQVSIHKPLRIFGGDSATDAKIALDQSASGQITDNGTKTIFGFTSSGATDLKVGSTSYSLALRGTGTRPTYNGNDLALYSDITSAIVALYKPQGKTTVATLNGLTKTASMNGYVYDMTDSGALTNYDGTTETVKAKDNVCFFWNNGDWYWDNFGEVVDLSGYVQKTTEIAGIQINTGISDSDLLNALFTVSTVTVEE